MKKTSLFLSLALALVLSSCDEGKGQYAGTDPQDGLLLSFSAVGEPALKVSVGSDGATALEDGDRAIVCVPSTGVSGVYVYSSETSLFVPESEALNLSGSQAYICYPADYFTAPSVSGGDVSMTLPESSESASYSVHGFKNPMAALLDGSTLSSGTASVQLKNIGSILRINLTGADAESGTVSSISLTSDVSISGTSALTWSNGSPVLSAFDGSKVVTADCGDYDLELSTVPASFNFFLPAGVETNLSFDIVSDKNEYISIQRGAALSVERATLYEVNKSISFAKTFVEAEQSKFYMTAAEDLLNKVSDKTAGMKVLLADSKYYARGERVLSVRYTVDEGNISGVIAADGTVVESGKSVMMTWASAEPVERPVVGSVETPGEYGIHCFPGTYSGKFTVVTNRYTYEFTKAVTLEKGAVTSVTLDFAAPDVQPVRKVGVIGDSISTFDGELCNPEFAVYYPANDPNVGVAGKEDIAIDSKEKTWWWRIIYEKMTCGQLDANNSWSGSKVIHEFKNGRYNKKPMEAGFVDRAYEFVDPDIILIHGGTNDSNNDSPLGEYIWNLPVGQNDITTYRGAYIELIKKLQNRYEGVQIIIIVGDHLLTDYAESTIAIAEHFGLPYVDFATAANADGQLGDPVNIPKCKGSHPTAEGFTYMVNNIYETCKDYLP